MSLEKPTAEKVPASYKQNVRVNGQKAAILSSTYSTIHGIFIYSHKDDQTSMRVPLDDWLRSQLTFFQDKIIAMATFPADVPKSKDGSYLFRPMFTPGQDSIMIPMSKWCKIFKFNDEKGLFERVDKLTPFAKSSLSVTIEVSHVYIGPHKGGHNFSLSLRVKQLVYNAEEKEKCDIELINDLFEQASSELDDHKKKRQPKKQIGKCSKVRKTSAPVSNVNE